MITTVDALYKAVNGPGGLNKLSGMDLPVKTAYAIGRLVKSASKAMDDLNKERTRLFEAYGEPVNDPEGNDTGRKQIKKEHEDVFKQEIEAFTSQEREIWFNPIPMKTLEDLGVKLSADDMVMLEVFILSDEEKEPG